MGFDRPDLPTWPSPPRSRHGIPQIAPRPAAVATAGLTVLLAPAGTSFSLNGSSLALDQRDFRVFNNFTDPEANDNTTPHPSFPGYTGAVLAIWKGAVEWGSELHGDGAGDPVDGNLLGSGGANFDFSFQGEADGPGTLNGNVLSELAADGGGILAFTEGQPYSDGWRTRFYATPWIWQDGPGDDGAVDIQGVATHQFGLGLGLGNSFMPGATMFPGTITDVELRSIEADDVAGLKAIYAPKSPTKPRILDTTVDVGAGVLTLVGENFGPANNTVWFTRAGSGGNGTPVKVAGLASTGGGTQIVVGVPAAAGPGDVLVQKDGSAGSDLSNAWPFDPAVAGFDPVGVTGVTPIFLPAVVVDGPPVITLTGFGFLDVTAVTVDGLPLASSAYAVVDDGQLDLTAFPLVGALGPVPIEVATASHVALTSVVVTAPDPPNLDLADSLSEGAFLSSATGLDITLGGVPGDLLFLVFSGSANPSILPGFVAFAIGNNFFDLFGLGSYVVPSSGYVHVALPVTGDLTGVTIHLQSAYLEAGSTTVFPLGTTNVQSGTFAD